MLYEVGTIQPSQVYAIVVVLVVFAGAILYFLGKDNDSQ